MASAPSRLRNVLGHLLGGTSTEQHPAHHISQLSPTFFLERAAAIEPDAEAVYHVTANGKVLRRSYMELADRARGLAYYLRKHGHQRVGLIAPNTPAFLESVYGIVAAGGVIVPVNIRLKPEDITYILEFAEVDSIIIDAEYESLLDTYRAAHPTIPILVDLDTDANQGALCGPFDDAVLEGLTHDRLTGAHGWSTLQSRTVASEDATISIPFTSGTTSRPKGVIYTHRGAYLATLANIVESGLNLPGPGRCKYLWTLPMFHAVGWTFPWAVCAVRGTHVCLRKIDYPLIWSLLTTEGITHFNAAPTVNTLLCASPHAVRLADPVRVTVAASPPTAHLFETMTSLNLHPVHVYGLTETYGPITRGYTLPAWDALPAHERFTKMARQGHGFLTSLPVRVVRVGEDGSAAVPFVDVRKDGEEVGEIVFYGNICCKGYYKDEEATRKLFEGGGLHSGDLAVVHEDGAVQIRDRAKDIIISGGENISSVALEGMLVEHPDVLEAGVVAVPDSHWGERPKAYLTVKEGKEGLKGEDVIDWAKHQSAISKFMVPREVAVVRELPKTSTGKIKKNVLREWAKKGTPVESVL
ncbi:acetate/butyrate--CoA ligase AAE7, peroxisomal [Podospora conica]|nr:acetate/butyrate--CoA ligase AAE7, peroxisomal [Schizothecium conicum]